MDSQNLPGLFDTLPEQLSILDEAAVLDLLTERVEALMRDDLDLLLSSLYRLDVEEHKIQHALKSDTIPHAQGIAKLILERQKERLKTRQQYKSGEQKDWEGL